LALGTGARRVKLVEFDKFPFNRVEITWHGPYEWTKAMGGFASREAPTASPGIYRAETLGRDRSIIKYIGSASDSFAQRLTSQHRIRTELVEGNFRKVRMFLGVLQPERRITLQRRHYVELEYILQHTHLDDLVSWHGLAKMPKTSRGEGWHIVNKARRGGLHRVVAYPAFAVSGRDT
jgi:hypothetical protein